jgi:hypothetical protein
LKSALAAIILSAVAGSSAAGQTIPGTWEGSLNTPGATVPWTAIFQVKGDSLFGTMVRSTGDVSLFGHVKKDSVTFQYTIQYNGDPFTMKLRGKIVGDTLSGIVDFGEGTEDTFGAKRIIEKPDTAHKAVPASRGGGTNY